MFVGTKEQYESRHGRLMEEWKAKHGLEYGFAEDGIIYPDTWFSLPAEEERILFLLKEAYSKETENLVWDEAKWLAHQQCVEKRLESCPKDCSQCSITGSTFNPVAEWIYGIRLAKNGDDTEYDNWLGVRSGRMQDYYAARDALLLRAALVNIKKSGGNSSSHDSDLYYHAARDKDYLVKQIELINPTVIICGGTYGMLRCLFPELEKLDDVNNGYIRKGDIKIIASCHPNSRKIANEKKYEDVINNYKRAFNQRNTAPSDE